MKTLIIIDHNPTGKALQRYLLFLYECNTTIINFAQLKKSGVSPYLHYDLIILDIYENSSGINYGAQFGHLFEQNNKRIIHFFTTYAFKENCSVNDLPDNCFYIPLQIEQFLHSPASKFLYEGSSEKLMTILNSRPITSSHH